MGSGVYTMVRTKVSRTVSIIFIWPSLESGRAGLELNVLLWIHDGGLFAAEDNKMGLYGRT